LFNQFFGFKALCFPLIRLFSKNLISFLGGLLYSFLLYFSHRILLFTVYQFLPPMLMGYILKLYKEQLFIESINISKFGRLA